LISTRGCIVDWWLSDSSTSTTAVSDQEGPLISTHGCIVDWWLSDSLTSTTAVSDRVGPLISTCGCIVDWWLSDSSTSTTAVRKPLFLTLIHKTKCLIKQIQVTLVLFIKWKAYIYTI